MNKRNISVLPKSKSPHFFLQCRHHVLVKLVLWGPLTQMTPGGRFLPDHPLPQPDFLASCPTRHLKLCQHPGILAENPHQFSPTFSPGKRSCQLGTLPGRVSLEEAAHTEMSLSGQDLFPSPAHPPLQPFWLPFFPVPQHSLPGCR